MSEPLDELYFTWLYRQVGSTRAKDPNKTYWSVLRQLFTTEFVWFVPNDDNRVEDGRDLRNEFLFSSKIYEVDPDWLNQGCSFLEMMIALSRRVAFQMEGKSVRWFWHLMKNLGIDNVVDSLYDEKVAEHIQENLERVVWRTYDYSGFGGIFPLEEPEEDQCDVEIWYQAQAYLMELEHLK